MAVDYREFNMQSETMANQLPYQPSLFQRLGGQEFFTKVDNLWGYHQLRLAEICSNVIRLLHGGISLFGMFIWHLNCPG